MDAIVTAGGIFKPDNPLYQQFGIEKKALLPIAGKPMISWVLDALRNSGEIDHMAVVGLKPEDLNRADNKLHFAASTGNLVDNVYAGLYTLQEHNPTVKKLVLFSSDIPLVTPEIVRGFIEECGVQDVDSYYSVVKKEVMEAKFPNSKRTFVPMKDGYFSGGDAFLFDVHAAMGNADLAKSATSSRKNYLQQAQVIGFGFIIKVLLRRMTAQEAGQHAIKKAGLTGKVVITKYAELGMDVDKLHQYEMIKEILEKQIS